MQFESPLIEGTLIKRYKRFLADVELTNGDIVTAHSPNTGSMLGCCIPGSRVWLRDSGNPDRKYPLTWELVEALPDTLVGINTGLPNHLVREAIEEGVITELQGYESIRPEVRYGQERSRIDLLLENGQSANAYVEVKNVTLGEQDIAYFPDAISERGRKHLRELALMVNEGHRGVILFCVQRHDVNEVQPADHIDPAYGETLREVVAKGVEALAYQAEIGLQGIRLVKGLPVVLD